MIFDTHCHLNAPELYERIDEVIEDALWAERNYAALPTRQRFKIIAYTVINKGRIIFVPGCGTFLKG